MFGGRKMSRMPPRTANSPRLPPCRPGVRELDQALDDVIETASAPTASATGVIRASSGSSAAAAIAP
jgi:hypothetical protein